PTRRSSDLFGSLFSMQETLLFFLHLPVGCSMAEKSVLHAERNRPFPLVSDQPAQRFVLFICQWDKRQANAADVNAFHLQRTFNRCRRWCSEEAVHNRQKLLV